MIPPDQIAEWKRLEAGATRGPWWQRSHDTPNPPTPEATELSKLLCFFNDEGEPRFWDWMHDGAFVVAAREAVPELIAEVERLQAERDYWNADARRMSACLLAIHQAPESATIAALKSVAYDASLNCITEDVAEFQIIRRSANEVAARNAEAEREADAREG